MSAARAWSIALQIALGSLAEVAMTSTPCWVSVLMKLTWEEALASVGPTSLYSPSISPTAASPPPSATSKYGLFSCLGRKAIFSPEGISASGSASAPELSLPLPLVSSSPRVVPPQAAVVSTIAATATPVRPVRSRRLVRKLDMGSLSLGPASGAGVCGGGGRSRRDRSSPGAPGAQPGRHLGSDDGDDEQDSGDDVQDVVGHVDQP